MDKSARRFQIIPPDENRCIWMTAGIVQYRLCDREYRCEDCPLDAALRRQISRRSNSADEGSHTLATGETVLRDGFRYSRKHCWTSDVGPHRFRVGIEPGLSRAIGTPKTVVLPSQGQHVGAGQTCLWVVMTGGTLPLESPIGGIVRVSNAVLTETPNLLHQSPFDQGWLFEVEADEDEQSAAELLAPEDVAARYASDESRLLSVLSGMLRANQPNVGLTLADGGQRLESIAYLVGAARYFHAVRQIYG